MRQAPRVEIIRIETPKRYVLDGIWFGQSKAKRVFIFVHGLGGNAFGMNKLLSRFVSRDSVVLTFNNRGHDTASRLRKRIGKDKEVKINAGMAHEVFVDCADDIAGAVSFAKRRRAKEIILVGHSTGSQKTAYYLAKNGGRGVRAAALLAPLSDYADSDFSRNPSLKKKALAEARKIARRNPHALMPATLSSMLLDAQRFISLYAGEGREEIFTYWHLSRRPTALKKIKTPLFVALAGSDEHADRSAKDIGMWFAKHLKDGDAISIISGANHGFKDKEKELALEFRRWLSQR